MAPPSSHCIPLDKVPIAPTATEPLIIARLGNQHPDPRHFPSVSPEHELKIGPPNHPDRFQNPAAPSIASSAYGAACPACCNLDGNERKQTASYAALVQLQPSWATKPPFAERPRQARAGFWRLAMSRHPAQGPYFSALLVDKNEEFGGVPRHSTRKSRHRHPLKLGTLGKKRTSGGSLGSKETLTAETHV